MKAVRNVREPLKKPRPLKSSSSSEHMKVPDPKDSIAQKPIEDILEYLEILNVSISNGNFDEVTISDISRMCTILKRRGEELDASNKYRDEMDRYFITLRNASREERLDMVSRVKLLELIELRSRKWKSNENIDNYFITKIAELEQTGVNGLLSHSQSMSTISFSPQGQSVSPVPGIPFQHGEILRSSGKFSKPTKITGKNYFKDEIVIRNSDSGKVNPGARDRLVQITGPHEDAIGRAKLLVEDTIRRNASPIRDASEGFDNKEHLEKSSPLDNQAFVGSGNKRSLHHSFSTGDATLKEFTCPVLVGTEVITLTGTNSDLVKTAQLVLKQFFTAQPDLQEKYSNSRNLNRQTTPDNGPRYELSRQSSLRSAKENFSPNWNNNNRRQDSVSTLSSSDDDILKDDGRPGSSSTEPVPDISPRAIAMSLTEDFNLKSLENSLEKVSRSFSVPNDFTNATVRDEVFSPDISEIPPIPPPSYKKKSYSRDFLLSCARSPYSRTQPPDYALMHHNFEEIIAQAPVMFDPAKYERTKLSED